ncbi:MAG: hypothetical protein A6D91_08525 [Bacillaceae bacterium G1]|nr:MAG: hypothetical protein A6D91_08525 [Bacillaceae bacterium G1]
MDRNVGTADRWIRVVVGLALLSMLLFVEGNLKWLGLIGLIPLLTAAVKWCPLYTLFGIRTCPKER